MIASLVLMYHRIGAGVLADRQPGEQIYTVSPESFRQQMQMLGAARARVLSPSAFESEHGGREQDRRPGVLLSFDDGNASDHEVAFPVLRQHGWSALFFVSPALVGRPGYATWSQLREMSEAGMSIGAHGLDHTPLTSLDDGGLARQMKESYARLGAELGTPPRHLSLPNGAGGPREIAAAKAAGFEAVFGSLPERVEGLIAGGAIPRIAIRGSDSSRRFVALVEGHRLTLLGQRLRHRLITIARRRLGERFYARARRALTAMS